MIRRLCSSSRDRLGGRLEEDDVVRALAVAVDGIGQPAAAPRGDLDDLAAGGHDLAGRAVDDRLALVVRDIGTEHEHEFVSAHMRSNSFRWGSPVDGVPARSRKDQDGSLARGPGEAVRPPDAVARRRPGGPAADTRRPAGPLYPLGQPPKTRTRCDRTPGGSVPASSIFLLDADTASAEAISTILTERRLHRHRHRRPGRRDRQGGGPPAGHRRRRRPAPKSAAERLPDDPGDAGDGRGPDPVRQPDRRRRGADRASSRRAPTTSWPSPSTRRELEARVEALLLRFQRSGGHGPGLLGRRPDDGPGAAHDRRLQPEGRRRDDDHRHQHRGGRRPAPAGPGGPRRPGPPVRRRLEPPQPRAARHPRRPRPRRDRDARAGDHAAVRHPPRLRAPRPGRTGHARGRRPGHPGARRRRSSRTCWRATTRSSSTPARCSTSAR